MTTKLLSWKESKRRKPLVLRGARQVGKSWVLKDFGKSFRKSHYINFERSEEFHGIFESLDPKEIVRKIELLTKNSISFKDDVLIFDEIQVCGKAITSLKYFYEELPELAVCSAGSHIGLSLTGDSWPVGKVLILDMYPMTFEEFLMEHNEKLVDCYNAYDISDFEHKLLWKEYLNYIFCGGMPEAVNLFKDELVAIQEVNEVQNSLLISYCSDFSRYSGAVDGTHIEATYKSIPAQLELSHDSSVSRFKFKGIIPNRSKLQQFKGPIDWLTRTNLVLKNKRISKMEPPLRGYAKENLFKLFWHDVGLLHRELDIDFTEVMGQDYGTYKGFIAENFVAQELVAIGMDLQHWDPERTASEIEFLVNYQGSIIPCEVKSGVKSRASKSLKVFKEKFNPEVSLKLSGMNLRFEEKQINAPLYLAGRIADLLEHFNKNKT